MTQQLWSWFLRKSVENLCPLETYTQMFIATVFIIAKNWEKPLIKGRMDKQTDTSIQRNIIL